MVLLFLKFQEAQERTRQRRQENRAEVRSKTKLPRAGISRGKRSMRICLFSTVALAAPRKLIQRTPCLSKSSPQTIPVKKKFRRIICMREKTTSRLMRKIIVHFSILTSKWLIHLKALESLAVKAFPLVRFDMLQAFA